MGGILTLRVARSVHSITLCTYNILRKGLHESMLPKTVVLSPTGRSSSVCVPLCIYAMFGHIPLLQTKRCLRNGHMCSLIRCRRVVGLYGSTGICITSSGSTACLACDGSGGVDSRPACLQRFLRRKSISQVCWKVMRSSVR